MHEPRFKKLLHEFFAEFFWLFFPTWAARFDFGSVEWLDKESVLDGLQAWPGDRLRELGRALMSATSLDELGLQAPASGGS